MFGIRTASRKREKYGFFEIDRSQPVSFINVDPVLLPFSERVICRKRAQVRISRACDSWVVIAT